MRSLELTRICLPDLDSLAKVITLLVSLVECIVSQVSARMMFIHPLFVAANMYSPEVSQSTTEVICLASWAARFSSISPSSASSRCGRRGTDENTFFSGLWLEISTINGWSSYSATTNLKLNGQELFLESGSSGDTISSKRRRVLALTDHMDEVRQCKLVLRIWLFVTENRLQGPIVSPSNPATMTTDTSPSVTSYMCWIIEYISMFPHMRKIKKARERMERNKQDARSLKKKEVVP